LVDLVFEEVDLVEGDDSRGAMGDGAVAWDEAAVEGGVCEQESVVTVVCVVPAAACAGDVLG
jgi:hypothetical protein